MAKKQHNIAPPNPHSVPNRDIMQRLNFLYQASTWLSSLPATKCSATQPAALPVTSPDTKGGKVTLVTPAYLSRSYVSSMKAIGQKTVVKLLVCSFYLAGRHAESRRDPSVKRTICKGCNTLLIPGMTATVRSGCTFLLSWYEMTLSTTCSFTLSQEIGQSLVSELQDYPAVTSTTSTAGRFRSSS
jgi:ribonuclease P protein subunit RPR2